MSFKIYKGDDVVVEGESPLTITGIDPNTDVSEGDYQAVRVEDDKESDRVDIPAFKTLPIEVTSVTINPKTIENDSGIASGEDITADVQPSNATNKTVTFKVEPQTEGLSVNNDGRVEWTADVANGEYTITATTQDGNKTDTCKLTLKEPVISVTGVTLSPKTSSGETGEVGNKQLSATVEPTNATNKSVSYEIDSADGLAVSENGNITWTDSTPAGKYTTTVKTSDGEETDTHELTLTDPEPEPDPEEGE